MSHKLFIGRTGTGKSTLAKTIVRGLLSYKRRVVILDPAGDPNWPKGATIYHDTESFELDLKTRGPAHVFIDESPEVIERYRKSLWWIALRGRHLGHNLSVIAQDPVMIPPSIRRQAEQIYVFRVSPSGARLLADEYGHDELEYSSQLRVIRGKEADFLYADSNASVTRYTLDYASGIYRLAERQGVE